MRQNRKTIQHPYFLIAVSALGYFVDVYDLLLFSVVRKKSLLDLGVSEIDSLNVGLRLLNFQMAGLVIGGIMWGIFGDKRGRLSVLFGSIILYSVANFLNGYVVEIWQYSLLRLIAGIGLAGELGAGITLVSEVMSPRSRGIGTMVVATVGLLGAVVASYIGLHFDWRHAYILGGTLGLVLLVLRVGVYESGLYTQMETQNVRRGNIFQLVSNNRLLFKYVKAIGVGLPTYFVVGLLVTGAPEFGSLLGVRPIPVAGLAVMLCYIGLAVGDVVCSSFSQIVQSRRKAFFLFNVFCGISIVLFLVIPSQNLTGFYFRCFLMGFSVGYWALITTNAAEQFGTNLRATVATTVPNFVRAALIPIAYLFNVLKGHYSPISSAIGIGFLTVILALIATKFSDETFGRDLNFLDK